MQAATLFIPQIGIATERLRHPEIAHEPLILARDNRVVIVSPEAALSAIRIGDKVTGAKNRCPELIILPYDEPCYRAATETIWDALAIETSVVEPVSPEYVYAELDGLSIPERLQHLIQNLSTQMQTPIHGGLASGKFVAKQAAMQSEPGRLYVVSQNDQASFLEPLSILLLEFVDADMRRRMKDLGIYTLGDIQKIPVIDLEKQFGYRAQRLSRLAFGIDTDFVKAKWPMPGIQEGFRFDEIDGMAEENIEHRFIEHGLRCCTERIAARLESERIRTKRLELRIDLRSGEVLEIAERLEMVIDDRKLIFACALRLLQRLNLVVPPDRLTVTASELGIGSGVQLGLIDECGRDTEQVRRLENTLRTIRRKYGPQALSNGTPTDNRIPSLFTSAMTHRRVEPIRVRLNEHGYPIEMTRVNLRGQSWQISIQVYDHWVETRWAGANPENCQVYRAQSDDGGFFEISCAAANEWQLTAIAD